MVNKMFLPIIKKYYKLLLSIMIISALGCAFMTGLSSGYDSLSETLNKYVIDYGYPDAIINTNLSDKKNDNKDTGIIANNRINLNTIMLANKNYYSVRVFSYDKSFFSKFNVWQTINKDYDNYVLVEKKFADSNKINVGDKVAFKVEDEYREMYVKSIVSLPETLAITPVEKSWGANNDFGFIYVPIDLLKEETTKKKNETKLEIDSENNKLEEEYTTNMENYYKLSNELDNAYYQLNGKKVSLNSLKKELLSKKNELTNQENNLKETLKTLKETKQKLEEAKEALNQIDAILKELEAEYNSLNDPKVKEAIAIFKEIPGDTKLEDLYRDIDTLVEYVENFMIENLNSGKNIYFYMRNYAFFILFLLF